MPSTITDRLQGITTSVAVKPPCRVVSSLNITLAGLQTIGSVTLVADDRVLVNGQTDQSENGIYNASTGDWTRAKDFDGNRDVVQGTLVPVVNGASGANLYEVTTANPIIIDMSNISFSLRYGANIRYDQTASEISAGVTPTDYAVQPQNPLPKRTGAAGDNNGTVGNGTNDTSAIALTVAANLGWMVDGGGLRYRVSSVLPASPVPVGFHLFNGEVVSDQMVTTQDEYSVTVFGRSALMHNTYIPEQNAASGGRFFASGNHIVAIGREALKANTTGRRNTAVGSRALLGNTTGYYQTALGSHTLEVVTTGFENTAVGVQSLQATSTGHENTGCGVGAGLGISTGSYNTGVGKSACGGGNGAGETTGDYNTCVGYRAGYFITSATGLVAVGRDAAVTLTTGANNTAVGATALTTNSTGANNTAVGNVALRLATGDDNTAVGADALAALTTGTRSTAIGRQAGAAATSQDDSVFVGYRAGLIATTGDQNTLVGGTTGATLTTGSNNTLIGRGADCTAASSNSTSLGNGATCTGDNQVTLGNGSIATLRCQQTSITALSDSRFKKNIRALDIPDAFLDEIEIVVFEWTSQGMPEGLQVGVIAQQLDALQEKYGLQWLGLVDKSNPARWEATPGKLLFPLIVKAQKQSKEFLALADRVSKLER